MSGGHHLWAITFCLCLWAGAASAQYPTVAEGTLKPFSGLAPGITVADQDPEFFRQLDLAIDATSRRFLDAGTHSPWQIFHAVLAMRKECELKLGTRRVNALEWISTAKPRFAGRPWIVVTGDGPKFHPFRNKYEFEGHPGQFLALLSESGLPMDHKLVHEKGVCTIRDIIQTMMREVNRKEEITWILWGLNNYLPTNTAWTNRTGETWSIELLVQIQTAQAVHLSACGGNHGLYAIARARDKHLATGAPLKGIWFEADAKVQKHIQLARSLQNTDGSISADFYQGPKLSNDLNSRLNTTGHTLEFVVSAIADDHLNDLWLRRAVCSLSKDLIDHRRASPDCGPMFHSLNALRIYRERTKSQRTLQVAVAKPDLGIPALPATVSPVPTNPPSVPAALTPPAKTAMTVPGEKETAPVVDPKSSEPLVVTAPPADKPISVPMTEEKPAQDLSGTGDAASRDALKPIVIPEPTPSPATAPLLSPVFTNPEERADPRAVTPAPPAALPPARDAAKPIPLPSRVKGTPLPAVIQPERRSAPTDSNVTPKVETESASKLPVEPTARLPQLNPGRPIGGAPSTAKPADQEVMLDCASIIAAALAKGKLAPGRLASDVVNAPSLPSVPASSEEPLLKVLEPTEPLTATADEPVSALTPVNQSSHATAE